ncbi:hypothetical protein HDV05_006295, partial [Chytridiales sp. JEL 0842]
MAQLVAAGVGLLASTAATAGVIYLQPHSVVAILVKRFPRIIWCLSAEAPPLRESRSASPDSSVGRSASPAGALSAAGVLSSRWEDVLRTLGLVSTQRSSRTRGRRRRRRKMTGGGTDGQARVSEECCEHRPVSGSDGTIPELDESRETLADQMSTMPPSGSMYTAWNITSRLSIKTLIQYISPPTQEKAPSDRGHESSYEDAEEDFESVPMGTLGSPTRMPLAHSSEELERFESAAEDMEEDVEVGLEDLEDDYREERLPGVSHRVVALSIDDSPSMYTADALDILRANGCRATFFIIGSYAEEDGGSAILDRMVAEGHELGNHTWYDRPTIRLPLATFEEELIKVDQLIQKHDPRTRPTQPTSEPPLKWFRPGVGFWTPKMVDIAEKHGYRTVLGCRFPYDTASTDP